MESHGRSVAKAITWRVLALVITVGTTWMLSGQASLAMSVGAVDALVKVGWFYLHERAWNRFAFGRVEPHEYQTLRRGGE